MKKAFLLLATLMTVQIHGAQAGRIDPNTIVVARLINTSLNTEIVRVEEITYRDALKLFRSIYQDFEVNQEARVVTFMIRASSPIGQNTTGRSYCR